MMKDVPTFAYYAATEVSVNRVDLDLAGRIDRALEELAAADTALRARISILYPTLPTGYWWVRQAEWQGGVDGLDIRIRYLPMHQDDIYPGTDAWRP